MNEQHRSVARAVVRVVNLRAVELDEPRVAFDVAGAKGARTSDCKENDCASDKTERHRHARILLMQSGTFNRKAGDHR
jgi:hypothetical protein